jgi:hypothetical protein
VVKLLMEVYEQGCQLVQRAEVYRRIIHECPAFPAGADLPADDASRLIVQLLIAQGIAESSVFANLELRFHDALLRFIDQYGRIGTLPEDQGKSAEDDAFTRAGFARHSIEAGVGRKDKLIYDGVIADRQLLEHNKLTNLTTDLLIAWRDLEKDAFQNAAALSPWAMPNGAAFRFAGGFAELA